MTVYGQKNLPIPSRVIVDGDSGIFYTKKEELILLKYIEQRKMLKNQVDSLTSLNEMLSDSLKECKKDVQGAAIDLNKVSKELYETKNNSEDKSIEKTDLENQLIHEKKRSKVWRKTALGTVVFAAGAIGFGVTGLWLPALAVVTVTEIAIIFTNKEK